MKECWVFLLILRPLEISSEIAIIVGWNTRLIALFFADFCSLSALFFDGTFTDQLQMAMFMKT